jgi:putative ABC transport system permease protein
VLAYAAAATARAPAGALPAGATLRAVKRLTAADGDMLRRIRLLLVLVTAVALVAAALCATSTLADLVLERTPEIALLRALGAGRGDLLSLFVGEAAALGLVGGVFGIAVGLVAAQAIGWGVFGSEIRPTPAVIPITLALGVATAVFASIAPVRDALAVEPARVLRGE